jgi:hypothetical protein
VRAIRETWGADSGTNVTKTEYFYWGAVVYRYRVRVHPIPPDGLYTSWDYNHNAVGHYYNELNSQTSTEGVLIDGVNDDVGNIDGVGSFPAFFDAPDPTFSKPLANLNWEQVSGNGDNGSLVYMFEMKNPQALENAAVVPYYRDDACFDDGTGDDPTPHPHPGDFYTAEEKAAIPCYTEAPAGYEGPFRQGAFGSHGIHYFFTGDTDNSFSPERTTEIDGQQWQWAVSTDAPHAVGEPYANTVKTPLVATPAPQNNVPAPYATELVYTGDTQGQVTDKVSLSAHLSSFGDDLAGKTVSFRWGGEPIGSATTDGRGEAALTTTLGAPVGTRPFVVEFAGDERYARDVVATVFDVHKDDAALSLKVRSGTSDWRLSGLLTDRDDSLGLVSRKVVFSVNGKEAGSATTANDGTAVLRLPRNRVRKGDTVKALFAGDDLYLKRSVSVAAPARGEVAVSG